MRMVLGERVEVKKMSEWKNAFKELPTEIGYYLVERMDEITGDTWYFVDRFEPQDEYESRYSTEFKQDLYVKVRSNKPNFARNRGSFVTKWMKIPGCEYYGS